jgi:hypothetical protein
MGVNQTKQRHKDEINQKYKKNQRGCHLSGFSAVRRFLDPEKSAASPSFLSIRASFVSLSCQFLSSQANVVFARYFADAQSCA